MLTRFALYLADNPLMADASTLVIPSAALLAAVTAVYHAGVLRGRFDKHEALMEKRVEKLEDINGGRITREEMEARFDSVERQLGEQNTVLSRIIKHLEHQNRSST